MEFIPLIFRIHKNLNIKRTISHGIIIILGQSFSLLLCSSVFSSFCGLCHCNESLLIYGIITFTIKTSLISYIFNTLPWALSSSITFYFFSFTSSITSLKAFFTPTSNSSASIFSSTLFNLYFIPSSALFAYNLPITLVKFLP